MNFGFIDVVLLDCGQQHVSATLVALLGWWEQ